jgi:hypothetical protein
MTVNELYVFLDSESLDNVYALKKETIEKLISNDGEPFIIQRTSLNVNHVELTKITTCEQKQSSSVSELRTIEEKLFKKSLTEGEKRQMKKRVIEYFKIQEHRNQLSEKLREYYRIHSQWNKGLGHSRKIFNIDSRS